MPPKESITPTKPLPITPIKKIKKIGTQEVVDENLIQVSRGGTKHVACESILTKNAHSIIFVSFSTDLRSNTQYGSKQGDHISAYSLLPLILENNISGLAPSIAIKRIEQVINALIPTYRQGLAAPSQHSNEAQSFHLACKSLHENLHAADFLKKAYDLTNSSGNFDATQLAIIRNRLLDVDCTKPVQEILMRALDVINKDVWSVLPLDKGKSKNTQCQQATSKEDFSIKDAVQILRVLNDMHDTNKENMPESRFMRNFTNKHLETSAPNKSGANRLTKIFHCKLQKLPTLDVSKYHSACHNTLVACALSLLEFKICYQPHIAQYLARHFVMLYYAADNCRDYFNDTFYSAAITELRKKHTTCKLSDIDLADVKKYMQYDADGSPSFHP